MKLRILVTLIVVFVAGAGSVQAKTGQSLKTSYRSKKAMMKKQKPSIWGISFGYGGVTDLAEERERGSQHYLTMSPSVRWENGFSASVSLGVDYEMIENEIERDQNNPGISDLLVGISHRYNMTDLMPLNSSLSYTFPTSESSQALGLKGIIGAGLSTTFAFPRQQTQFNLGLKGAYFLNSYDSAPGATSVNPDSILGFNMQGKYNFTKSFYLGAGVGAQNLRRTDGFVQFSSSNRAFVGLDYLNYSTNLSYHNGNSALHDGVRSSNAALDTTQLDYFDEYRRVISWELSCSF